ncbi:PHB [Seminavis robusta]|uniref:PHB n=1 Tax=Seminavis robusta TaxID=568900 RepID=A0A9N8EWI6_9STRA|nr:PHB [Seminavis robusta]|eukprot:Sro2139_g316140.1 PHB (311) ;mRNA; f:9035-10105
MHDNNSNEAFTKLLSPQPDTMTARGSDEDEDTLRYYLDDDPEINSSITGCFEASFLGAVASAVCFPITLLACCGLTIIPERQHAAVLYFGKYSGSIQKPGIHFLPPIGAEFRYMSTATRTLNLTDIKVLDQRGNPIVVSAVVTFEPTSAKKARIDVENPWPERRSGEDETFLQLQAQAVLKQVASMFPYEAPPGESSLQTEGAHIADMLIARLQKRVAVAGARIQSFDLVDLSYAKEIASAMLVRQQAAALVDARKLIVKAAVDMTHQAVKDLEEKTGEPMSKEMRERTCANLLTVVCSSEAVTPTLPVG